MSRVVHPDFQSGQDYRPRPRNVLRRTISRYQLVELFVIIGAIFLLWGGSSVVKLQSVVHQAPLTWLESFRIEIIDGDSIRSGGQVYRLVGFDTPESGDNAKCPRERALSAEATGRLRHSSRAASSTCGASLAPARRAPKVPGNAITAGSAKR